MSVAVDAGEADAMENVELLGEVETTIEEGGLAPRDRRNPQGASSRGRLSRGDSSACPFPSTPPERSSLVRSKSASNASSEDVLIVRARPASPWQLRCDVRLHTHALEAMMVMVGSPLPWDTACAYDNGAPSLSCAGKGRSCESASTFEALLLLPSLCDNLTQ